ncbi:NADH dehydrogenase-like protein YutJ [Thalassobacillus devorans]|uniref:NADH dehydrogenase-like protein YutJ n=1 Tax=Thalassobacillus devorans TaxID=279813 RepID=A0ABQ1PND6_9BACI|nr:NAD(P)/FAD-dependent oxidoreductase [Thalassobacillus devorans]NIK30470.1 NADH dehydrogenase [Thalassobacillus devorans]GGD00028.1 NADH dehydrogenase-like protein YutJ [Thalassobacillus devorans]
MKRLVILGGGYGGVKILLNLLDKGLPKDTHITMIDRNPYHSLKTEFYAIAAGTESDKNVRIEFPEHDRVDYVYGEIEKIDTDQEHIIVRDNREPVEYDYLVIGLGCEDNYHGITGAKEFTESVQTFSKARHTGYVINNLKAYGMVSVVGAGLSGIEVASEIRESRPDLNIRLLDRGETVLRAFDKKIQDYVEEWFEKNDVEVIHNANVEYVEKDGVCNNGICYVNDVTIWTAGVRPNFLVRELPFEKDSQEKIILNDFYQVPEQPNVYVVGDCAASEYSPSAQLAGQQGEQIAEVLSAVLREKEPEKPGEIKLKGALGSLGKSDGFGNMLQKPVTGLLPRLAKSGVLWLNKRH